MATRFFRARPSATPTGHRIGLRLSDVLTNPPTEAVRAGVLLTLDLAAVKPEWAGTVIPFLELPVCGDLVRLQRAGDGRWTLVDQDFASDLESFWVTLEEETEDSMLDLAEDLADEGMPLGSHVALEESDEGSFQRPVGWEIGDPIRWLQYDRGFEAADYCGSVSSDYYFGTVHAFWFPETGMLHLHFECT